MKVYKSPQVRMDGKRIAYAFSESKISATFDGVTDVFDFKAVRSAVEVNTIRTTLAINPIEKVEYDGTLKITITNFIGPDASEEERYPHYNVDYAALIADVDAKEALREQAEIDRAATFDALVESEMVAQNVATKLAEKEATFAPRMLSLESELAEKVGGGLLATMADLGQDIKTSMTGGSVAVVGVDAVQKQNIVDKAVDAEKLHNELVTVNQSINLLDESYSRLGGYYSPLTGQWVDRPGLRSAVARVKPGHTYTKQSSGNALTYWDDNDAFVVGSDTGAISTFKVPSDNRIATIRYPIDNVDGQVMLVEGSTYPSTFVPYSREISVTDKRLAKVEKIPNSVNILNPERVINGGYYHFQTGAWTPAADLASTDFTEIKIAEKITLNTGSGQITFWDQYFNFVFGVDIMQAGQITGPTTPGVKYFKAAIYTPNMPINKAMIVRGDTMPSTYIPYAEEKYIFPAKNYEFESQKITKTYTTPEIKEHVRVTNPIITKAIVTDRINNSGGVADPFIVFDKGRYHMFFEILGSQHPVSGIITDEIGHAYSDNMKDWTYTQVVLPYSTFGHRSAYPNVFKIDEIWYMLPDTVGPIKLYRATNFPLEWEFVTNLMSDTNYVDTNVFKIGTVWYMTTSVITEAGANSIKLFYNISGDWKNTNWVAHPIDTLVVESGTEKGKRNAGNIFHGGDYIIFPSQVSPTSSGVYGEYTDWYKLSNITTTTATISKLGRALDKSGLGDWKDKAMHHISHVEHDNGTIFAVDGVKDGVYSIGLYTDA